ncbi:MAG: aminotransferase class I/II-fold pyridoxal phosphate-dependent enzyme [Cyclobacteriaceae bacterium]|nr:aminotransferase class I/II-fold pyridoxal phosphate-dependent enzyme [Cyclobacteriaceae bacterium]
MASIEEYYFSTKLKEVKALQSAGKPVINMGIGSPDLPPHPSVIEALNQTASFQDSHGYQNYQGIPALRTAFADFYQKQYGVNINGLEEILPLMGSKEGILHISMAFLNEGDQVLVPDPGYPTYTSVSNMLGVNPVYYNLKEENQWLPDFGELERLDLSKVKLMWVNYPHMPTGTRAVSEVMEKLVKFAKDHDIVLVNDNPYSLILEEKPFSIFQIPEAKEVVLELNSLSKISNMAGWRVGAVLGNRDFIQAITKVKSNVDSGMFLGIQKGAIAALGLDKDWYRDLNQIYLRRRLLIWELADQLGLKYTRNTAGMFVWAKLPEGQDCHRFVDDLLYHKHLFVTPGDIFGQNGEGWIRFSLCVPEAKIKEAFIRLTDYST